MRMRPTHAAVAGLLLILGARGAAAQEVMRWQVDGETREAIVYAPSSSGEDAAPLVLAFHGFGDNAQNFRHTSLHAPWPEAVVVYFQGLVTRRGLPGWQVERGGGDRDLELVDVALRSLRETYRIDDDRIYATGYSNGGMFTYLLWAERPGVFAAYAPVAARLRPSVRPTEARPVLHIGGERDRVVRFSDQQAAIAIALEVNDVSANDVTDGAGPTPCGAGCTVHGAGTAAPVMTWIHGGAHIYPRGTSQRIVSFFREHSRSR